MVLFPYEEKKWQTPLSEVDLQVGARSAGHRELEDVIQGSRTHLPAKRTYAYPRSGSIAALVDLPHLKQKQPIFG